jgi:hypothetical protein
MGVNRDTVLVYLWAPIRPISSGISTRIVLPFQSLALWPFDRTGELQHWCARWWCRLVAWTIFARIHVHGVEHVQARASLRLHGQPRQPDRHAGAFAYLPYQFRIMAEKEPVQRAVHRGGTCARPGTFPSTTATPEDGEPACGG